MSRKSFELNQKVWLFNSRLCLFPDKLRSRWDGLFIVTQIFPHGAIEIHDNKEAFYLAFKLAVDFEKAYPDTEDYYCDLAEFRIILQ